MASIKTYNFKKFLFFFIALLAVQNYTFAAEWAEGEKVVVDGDGNILVVWQSYDDTTGIFAIKSSRFDTSLGTGGEWVSPVTLSDAGSSAFWPDLAINDSGDAVAIWSYDDFSGDLGIVASIRDSGSSTTFQTPVTVSDSTDLAILSGNTVSINNAGDIVVCWSSLVDTTYTPKVRVAIGDTTGTFSAPQTISN